MIKVLILEDNDFDRCQNALSQLHSKGLVGDGFEIINTSDERTLYYSHIFQILDKYKGQFDLLIVDLQMPTHEYNGLGKVVDWMTSREEELGHTEHDFGIIAVTNHIKEEIENALGDYASELESVFLGVASKTEHFDSQLHRLISLGFFTPPFVRAGDKYLNTRLINERFPQFAGSIQLYLNMGDLIEISFKDIILIERKGLKCCVYTKNASKPYVGNIKFDGVKGIENFFSNKNVCYDPTQMESNKKETGMVRNYSMPLAVWQDIAQREHSLLQQREKSALRIKSDLVKFFPVFIQPDTNFIVNVLYIESYAHKTVIAAGESGKLFDKHGSNNVIGTVILKNSFSDEKIYYKLIPVKGRTQNQISIKGEDPVRYQDTSMDRAYAFKDIGSDRWQPLLKQLSMYYGIE